MGVVMGWFFAFCAFVGVWVFLLLDRPISRFLFIEREWAYDRATDTETIILFMLAVVGMALALWGLG